MNSQLKPFKEIAKELPKINGRPVHISSIWRWCHKGINGVKLKYVRLGRRQLTSLAYVEQFNDALTIKDAERSVHCPPTASAHSTRTMKQRDNDISDAEKTLEKDGF